MTPQSDVLIPSSVAVPARDIWVGAEVLDGRKVFTLSATPLPNSETLFWNGLAQLPEVDYTLNGVTVTLLGTVTPSPPDALWCVYFK